MGLPMGQKLVKSGSTWVRLCRTHISETTGWFYAVLGSMELSRPVVVQHHEHLTLTFDFQGQILKLLYLRNGRANWHEMKGIWVDRMLHPFCDFHRSPHPWPWPFILKGQNLKMLRNRKADWHGTKEIWVDRMIHPLCDFQLWPQPWPWPWIFKVKFL